MYVYIYIYLFNEYIDFNILYIKCNARWYLTFSRIVVKLERYVESHVYFKATLYTMILNVYEY